MKDLVDQFAASERGRFGEGEPEQQRSPAPANANRIDLDVIHHTDMDRPKAIFVSFGDRKQGYWLPRSQIEFVETGAPQRVSPPSVYPGRYDQKIRVTLPFWLASKNGIVGLV